MEISNNLKQEHQLILRYIGLMEEYIYFSTEDVSCRLIWDKAEVFVEFIQNFADGFHHAKEEDILFVHMASPGVLTHCNPLPQMLMEHDLGRKCVTGMKDAVKNNDFDKLIESTRAYGALLKEHIFKEDNILFPMAEEGIAETDKQCVKEAYETVEDKLDAQVLWEKYERIFCELEESLAQARAKKEILV